MALSYVGGTPTLTGNILNKGNTVALFTTVQLAQVQDLNGTNLGRFRSSAGGFQGTPSANQNQSGFQGAFGGDQQQASQLGQGGQQQFGQGQRSFAGAANSTGTFGGRGGGFRGSQAAQPQYLGDVTADSPVPFSITLDSLRNATAAPLRVTLLITYSDGLRNPHQMTVTQVVFPQAASGFNFRNQSGAGAFAFMGPLADYAMWIVIAIIVAGAAIAAGLIIRSRKRKAQRLNTSSIGDNMDDILQEPPSESKGQQRSKSRDERIK
jgi:hypothetical protein